ncbi:MAG: DegQ family serine endoprotease [Rhizobiales bacterium]|nr:DegQ family serine endoprotease [Hyphomicrobiales bacterium]MBI3673295.1 DegQ family serine endoprotease [Hyphomicrobiales bacterium]
MRAALAIVTTVLALAWGGVAWAGQATVPESQGQIRLSFAPVVKNTAPAVVNVYAQQLVAQRDMGLFDDPFFRQFFGGEGGFGAPRERVQNSLGSGVIVDPMGLIITNNHVVQGGTSIRVVLADNREFPAKLLLTDERTDLAVLKIEAADEKLPALAMGDSDNLQVGDLVLAIGNPFGVGQTVTSGIVSALARTDVGISDYQFFIQTDAAINPGNSGGALVNLAGELVGINTAIFSRSGGSIGIGFAIPVNMVKTVVRSAETGQAVKRPWLGAELQDVTQEIADSLGFARPEGALIVSLHAESPLAKAGLKRGDVVLAIEGKPVENARELGYRVATQPIGSTPIIEYQRGGKRTETAITLIAAPESVARQELLIGGTTPLTGVVAANLSPAVADELGLKADSTGVAITAIKGGPAQRFFRKGDIIRAVNGTAIDTTATLKKALTSVPGYWEIAVDRGGQLLKLTVGG